MRASRRARLPCLRVFTDHTNLSLDGARREAYRRFIRSAPLGGSNMPSRSPRAPRLHANPLDISPQPLSISTLKYRRGSTHAPVATSGRGDVEARVRCEFVEMRGFSPTVQQAARL